MMTTEALIRAALRKHWLYLIDCDHEARRDKAQCACVLVDLGWWDNVGEAVESWIDHVFEQAQGESTYGNIGHGHVHPRPDGVNQPSSRRIPLFKLKNT